MTLLRLIFSLIGIVLPLFALFGFTSAKPANDAMFLESSDSLPDNHNHEAQASDGSHYIVPYYQVNKGNDQSKKPGKSRKLQPGNTIEVVNLPIVEMSEKYTPIDSTFLNDDIVIRIRDIISKGFNYPFQDFKISIQNKESFLLLEYLGVSYRTFYGARIPQNKDFILINFSYEEPAYSYLEDRYLGYSIPNSRTYYVPIDGSKYFFVSRGYIQHGTHYNRCEFIYGDPIYNILADFSYSWDREPELREIYKLLFIYD